MQSMNISLPEPLKQFVDAQSRKVVIAVLANICVQMRNVKRKSS